jgi:hypothetical protein
LVSYDYKLRLTLLKITLSTLIVGACVL